MSFRCGRGLEGRLNVGDLKQGGKGRDDRDQRETYKMFCNSFEDVDLFACICFSACLPEYL